MFRRKKIEIGKLKAENLRLKDLLNKAVNKINDYRVLNKFIADKSETDESTIKSITRKVFGANVHVCEYTNVVMHKSSDVCLDSIPNAVEAYFKRADRIISEGDMNKRTIMKLELEAEGLRAQVNSLTQDKLNLLFKIRGAKI